MYRYDHTDRQIAAQRVAQFRDQTRRFLAGELSEDEFRPLRLQNGLYIQKHAPMLRVAIPYGLLHARQMRVLAHIARKYDRGYGHFTTRQNIQFNWPKLEDVPEILADLARVEMHANQTSGNCVRNVTSDHFAGIAADEIVDPRPWTEIIRQWSTFHPEFAYLPRKFKIAVSAAAEDRVGTQFHDIGLRIVRDEAGELGFTVLVGGGLGRTPILGQVIREFLPWQHLLTYLDAVLRVYNRFGRRDNLYKARIKILVKELILADVRKRDLHALWLRAKLLGFATPNIGLLTDIICCPGGDFCSLANAASIPVAEQIQQRFDDIDYLFDIGDLEINISGCMNACGQHHVGHIGILGVDKNGAEWYQVSIGGSQGNESALGKVIGPSFSRAQMADVIEGLIKVYVENRHEDEQFIDTARRIGLDPFKRRVYGERAHV